MSKMSKIKWLMLTPMWLQIFYPIDFKSDGVTEGYIRGKCMAGADWLPNLGQEHTQDSHSPNEQSDKTSNTSKAPGD